MAFTERRRASRFELQVPLIVRWTNGSDLCEARAVSENVSSRGVYFSLPQGIKDGTPVEIELTLPSQITRAGPARMRCFGRIQRCEQEDGTRASMAAMLNKYEFLPRSDGVLEESDS